MSIFNFSNLIKPENSGNPAKTEATKLRASEPSFKALVQKIVDEKHAASQNSAPTPEPVSVPTPVEIPVEQKPVPVEVREERASVPENLPAISEQVGVAVVETEPETTSEQKRNLEKTLEDNGVGTIFLQTMLSEFSDVLTAGKKLDELKTEKALNTDEQRKINAASEAEIATRTQIANSLSSLLTSETGGGELLVTALDSYHKYLDAFKNKYSSLSNQSLMEGNKLLMQINKKQKDIESLIAQIGGTEVFKEIKNIVSACKNIRIESLKNVTGVSELIKQDVISNVKK